MPENQTAWNSNSQVVKETFTQTGRRGGDRRWAAEQRGHKVVDGEGEAGLAERETKDSKPLGIKFCGGCQGRGNTQSHRRVCWKVGLEHSKQAALFPL